MKPKKELRLSFFLTFPTFPTFLISKCNHRNQLTNRLYKFIQACTNVNTTNTSSPNVINPQQHPLMQQQQQQQQQQMGYPQQQPLMHPHPQLMQQQQQHYNPAEYAQQQQPQPAQQYPQGYAPNAAFYAQSRPPYAGYQQYPPQANMVAGYPPAQQAQPQPQPQQQPQQIQRIYNPAAADMMQYSQQQPVRYAAPANPAPNLPLQQQQTQTPSQPQPQQPHYPMMNYQYQPSPYAHAPYAPPQPQPQQQPHSAAVISKDRSSSVDDMSKLNQPGTPQANSVLASKLAMSSSQSVTPQTPNAIRQQQQQQPHHGHHHGHHHHHHTKPVPAQLQLQQQQQAQPHQLLMSQSLQIGAQPVQFPMKKEIVFPPDSVEATIPVETKKRKIGAREIGKLEFLFVI
jgi:hypothetical protein